MLRRLIGIIVPFLGIILILTALSAVSSIKPENASVRYRLERQRAVIAELIGRANTQVQIQRRATIASVQDSMIAYRRSVFLYKLKDQLVVEADRYTRIAREASRQDLNRWKLDDEVTIPDSLRLTLPNHVLQRSITLVQDR